MSRLRFATLVVALALSGAAPAAAHEVTVTGSAMDVGIVDYDGFAWTVQLKARVSCSGADQGHVGVTFEQVERYTQVGGAAVYADPAPGVDAVRDVQLPPGRYQVRQVLAACESSAPMPDGHEGSHGAAMTNPPSVSLNLPDCRARAALRSPLVPVVGTNTDMRALCPARLCTAIGSSAARGFPLLPVIAVPPIPAPCPTVGIRSSNVPVDVVCGPGAVAAGQRPLLPVRGAPCRGSVELVGVSAGTANAAGRRSLGAKRFKIRRGSVKAVRIPLSPAARRTIRLTRVLRVRAVVRSAGKLRKSKPFTVLKR